MSTVSNAVAKVSPASSTNDPVQNLLVASKGKAIDDRQTDAVGRRSFLKKIDIAGASLASVLAVLVASSAMAQDIIVRFNRGIGVIPAATVGSANTVQGVQAPGDPWVIRALTAEVNQNGRIHVEGRGLLLAGGDGIGTNGGQNVFATLICGTALFSTPVANAVPLAADGDFTIDDVLSPVPPAVCANPVLLIRTAAGANPWFAAGIPVVSSSD